MDWALAFDDCGCPFKSILKRPGSPQKHTETAKRLVSFEMPSGALEETAPEGPAKLQSDNAKVQSALDMLQSMTSLYGKSCVVSTNFGAESWAILHLATSVLPTISVVWVDTGCLTPETYRRAEVLTKKLNLNLKVYQPEMSLARLEAIHGKACKTNERFFANILKVEPMKRALQDLNVRATVTGLRKDQLGLLCTVARPHTSKGNRRQVLPILNWSQQDVEEYLIQHAPGLNAQTGLPEPKHDCTREQQQQCACKACTCPVRQDHHICMRYEHVREGCEIQPHNRACFKPPPPHITK
jgi:phosphoadenylyl-sulfate reductase (thioredoxin)